MTKHKIKQRDFLPHRFGEIDTYMKIERFWEYDNKAIVKPWSSKSFKHHQQENKETNKNKHRSQYW